MAISAGLRNVPVIPPERGGLPHFLLLLTWLRHDEMHFRVWQGKESPRINPGAVEAI